MPARQIVDPADVEVPEGYEVEAVPVGLSVPTGIGFTKDRGQDVGEGRSV